MEMFAGKEPKMQIVTCPIDGQPCERACPDLFNDRPEGGCLLTLLAEQADTVLILEPDGLKQAKGADRT